MKKKESNKKKETIGFGCPNTIDPHHMVVTIPKARNGKVSIVEHFGLKSGSDGFPEKIERVELERKKWTSIADEVRRVFNERLKMHKLTTGRWRIGENKVERILGKELCVLAWSIEKAQYKFIPIAIKNWLGLKPEERWWLFTMTAAATGDSDEGDVGWRKALRYALTENPIKKDEAPNKKRSRKTSPKNGQMSFFSNLKD